MVAVSQPSIGSNIKVAKLQMFDMEAEKILGFLMVCRLYIRMKIRNILVEEQVQWVLSYIQERLADVWKENIIENLENGSLVYTDSV